MAEECRSCHARVIWATSAAEPEEGQAPKRQPLDYDARHDPAGKLEVWVDADGLVRYLALRKGAEPAAGRTRATSHYARCPDADRWRRGAHSPAAAPVTASP